jgi:hypothetical protein
MAPTTGDDAGSGGRDIAFARKDDDHRRHPRYRGTADA